MWSASTSLIAKVRDSSPSQATKIEELRTDLSVVGEVAAKIVDGTVILRDDSDPLGFEGRATFDLKVSDPLGTWSAQSFTNPFFLTRRLRISKGIFVNGAYEWVPLGTFQVTRCRGRESAGEHVAYISGGDLWVALRRAFFRDVYRIVAGTDLRTAIIGLLAFAGLTSYNIDPDAAQQFLLPAPASDLQWQEGGSVGLAMKQLLDDFGYQRWFDRLGAFTARSFTDLAASPSDYALNRAHAATGALERDLVDVEEFANDVIVVGTAPDVVAVRSEATDTVDGSITRADGPYGRRVKLVSSDQLRKTSQTADVANDELRRSGANPLALAYEGQPLIWLDPLDVLAVTDSKKGLSNAKYSVRESTIPLRTSGGSMSLAAIRNLSSVVLPSTPSLTFYPTTVGTSTVIGALNYPSSPHIFTMADGNLVAIYFNGTNGVYRIKNGGAWGAEVNFATSPTVASMQRWTRNGDDLYGLVGTGDASVRQRIKKFAYAASAITQSDVQVNTAVGDTVNTPWGVYWDATNNLLHVWLYVNDSGTGNHSYLEAWDSTLTNKIASTIASIGIGSAGVERVGMAGDGTSTFFQVISPNGASAVLVQRILAGAAVYTSQTAETGVTALTTSSSTCSVIWDGSYLLIFNVDGTTKIDMIRRTAINTYDALVTIATATLAAAQNGPAVCRRISNGDLVLFYRRNDTQANGEIYYVKRKGGVWDASPGTLFAGAAATGWSNASASETDLNLAGGARVVYLNGTANPWTLTEDGVAI